MRARVATFLSLFLLSTCLNADDGLFSLSFDELMQVKISTASKELESIEDAPGVISVITRSEIEKYGGNNLHDILRRIPGVIPHTSHLIPDNLISIRGQHSSIIDRRNLVLINGQPLRESQSGGAEASFYNTFPLFAIEQIEIIRGPGSVLHGSNAFSGVVNIVTRKDDQNAASFYGGEHSTFGSDFYYNHSENDWNLMVSGHTYDSDGWLFEANDINGVQDSHKMGENRSGLAIQVDKGAFSFNLFDGRVDQDFLGSNQSWPFDFYERRTSLYSLGYQTDLPNDWRLSANGTYNDHARMTESRAVDLKSNNSTFEINANGPLSTSVNGIFGLTYQELEATDASSSAAGGTAHWKTAFTQLDYQATGSLKLTLGGQFHDIGTDSDTSMRAAVQWQGNDHWGIKALFGEAYRSPYISELFSEIPGVLQGDPNLVPENMSTYDFQLYYHHENLRVDLTFFDSRITNAIGFLPVNGVRQFANTGSLNFNGCEMEFKYSLSNRLTLDSSFSYQKNENQTGIEGRQMEPSTMVKLGIAFQPSKDITLSIFDNYYSSPPSWTEFSSFTQILNPETGSYHHLTFNAKLPASVIFPGKMWEAVDLSFYIDNALRSSPVYWPDISRPNVNAWPRSPARRAYLKAKIRF